MTETKTQDKLDAYWKRVSQNAVRSVNKLLGSLPVDETAMELIDVEDWVNQHSKTATSALLALFNADSDISPAARNRVLDKLNLIAELTEFRSPRPHYVQDMDVYDIWATAITVGDILRFAKQLDRL